MSLAPCELQTSLKINMATTGSDKNHPGGSGKRMKTTGDENRRKPIERMRKSNRMRIPETT